MHNKKNLLIIDAHCDTLYRLALEPNLQPCVTTERLQAGGVSLQVFALWAGPDGASPFDVVQAQLKAWQGLPIQSVDSPFDARDGQVAGMLSIEGGEVFGSDLHSVAEFRKLGVRIVALTWQRENRIAFPNQDGEGGRIKPFGWQVLARMEQLGMAADVSHLSRRGFWDLIDRYSQPPMASHSCCHALCPHPRNLTDEQLRALIARGGWVGINFFALFLTGGNKATIGDVVRHIDHIAQLGGAANVGFGSDFDGMPHPPKGAEHPGCFPAILDALRARGYDEATVRGIAGENFLRYFRAVAES
ncbi:MAG: dipeptidase [Clostridia bacterium]|nr:dipeptidase [Clostridia bacterium]